MLTIRQLYPLLKKHAYLSEKRSPMYAQGKVAKFMAYFFTAFTCIYLIGFSIIFALSAPTLRTITAYEFMYSFTPFFVGIDFFFRFILQQTPMQQAKPYVLLPISRYTCIDFFIIKSLMSKWNLIWMFMFIPYSIMAIVFSEGFWLTIAFLLSFYIIELIVSQVYSIIRSLVNTNILWWTIAIPLFTFIAFPLFFNNDWTIGISTDHLFKAYCHLGKWFSNGNVLAWGTLLSILIASIFINRELQHKLVYKELARAEKTIKVSNKKYLSFLEETGLVGEFIKLELVSIRRNKNVRKLFISANAIVILLSLICSFTSTYDEMGMIKFWLIYNFAIYGAMMLLKIMTYEGNYIERLVMGHSTIEALLKAKFYIYSIILLFPFLLMLPMVITGKATLLMLTSYMVYTAGVDNFLFMQLAVYNKQTTPLNQKLTGKAMIENSWIMICIEILAFAMPLFLIRIFSIFSSENIAYVLLTIIGAGFILTHKLWIKNIYNRLAKKKYSNIESMIATRN